MHTDPAHSVIPLERYRDLVAAISGRSDGWEESYWLRLAAQAAVMCPEPTVEVAGRIRETASLLLNHATWYQTLASPARFLTAAMLIQHQIPATTFLIEHARIAQDFGAAGLRHGRFPEIVAVLIMLMAPEDPDHPPQRLLEIERIARVYGLMRRCHWWLTGPEDLPACAALAQCVDPAEAVMARVEDAYQQLHRLGLATGDHLQTAANLLPLGGIFIDRAIGRYRELVAALGRSGRAFAVEHYCPLAVLALLDHDAEVVVGRLLGVLDELDLMQPQERGEANVLIASDLVFLDLVRFGRDQRLICDAHGLMQVRRQVHVFNLSSAVLLSQVEPELVLLAESSAPTAWPG